MTALWFEAVSTVDFHTGGEPFRIVAAPPVDLPGATVAERRMRAIGDPRVDGLRKLLCLEPRGHADMYGGFITPPDDPGADLGVLFWHKDGFSTACGHGTIALGVWAVETGRVQAAADGATEVRMDVPSGRVLARVHTEAGRVTAVDFVNVASYLLARDVQVATSRGRVLGRHRLRRGDLRPDARRRRRAGRGARAVERVAGHRPRGEVAAERFARTPSIPATTAAERHLWDRGLDELGTTEDGSLHQRNVTIFADGEVDRSPCGSGSAARVAVLDARGDLGPGQVLVHDSIVGSTFTCRVVDSLTADGHPAVIPQITGMAYRCGTSEFTLDPRDPFVAGFVLR